MPFITKHSMITKYSNPEQMEYDSTVQAAQRQVLLDELNNQQFADITIIVGKEAMQYNVNRIFLSLYSPVFTEMLHGWMIKCEINEDLILEDMETEIFECILNFVYCNDPKVTMENVLPLIKACDTYRIRKLPGFCYEYLRSNLNENNFWPLCLEMIRMDIINGPIQEIVVEYLKKNTLDVSTNEFCLFMDRMAELNATNIILQCRQYLEKAESKVLRKMIQNDSFKQFTLKAMRAWLECKLALLEEEIWEAAINWAQYQDLEDDLKRDEDVDESDNQETIKIALLKSIYDLIRFGSMSVTYFAAKVVPLNVLTTKESDAVFSYYHNPRAGCGPFKISPRGATFNTVQFIDCDAETGHIDETKQETKTFAADRTLNHIAKYVKHIPYPSILSMVCDIVCLEYL